MTLLCSAVACLGFDFCWFQISKISDFGGFSTDLVFAMIRLYILGGWGSIQSCTPPKRTHPHSPTNPLTQPCNLLQRVSRLMFLQTTPMELDFALMGMELDLKFSLVKWFDLVRTDPWCGLGAHEEKNMFLTALGYMYRAESLKARTDAWIHPAFREHRPCRSFETSSFDLKTKLLVWSVYRFRLADPNCGRSKGPSANIVCNAVSARGGCFVVTSRNSNVSIVRIVQIAKSRRN